MNRTLPLLLLAFVAREHPTTARVCANSVLGVAHSLFDPDGVDRTSIIFLERDQSTETDSLRRKTVSVEKCSEPLLAAMAGARDYSFIDVAAKSSRKLQKLFERRRRKGLTLFAPDDDAFVRAAETLGTTAEALLEEPELAAVLVRFHVVLDPGVSTEDIENTYRFKTALRRHSLFGGNYKQIAGPFNGARIRDAIQYCQQRIYRVDEVLLPVQDISALRSLAGFDPVPQTASIPPHSEESIPPQIEEIEDDGRCLVGTSNLFQTIRNSPGLTIWTQVIQLAEVESVFADKGTTVTVFAPSDAAFLPLLLEAGGLSELVPDAAKAREMVSYHTLDGAVTKNQLSTRSSVETQLANREGRFRRLTIQEDDTCEKRLRLVAKASSAAIVQADIIGCNSVVMIVDDVLLPIEDFFVAEIPNAEAVARMEEELG